MREDVVNAGNFFKTLLHEVPEFQEVYDEHLHEYDEILQHLLMADLLRFCARIVVAGNGDIARRIMDLLERGIDSGDAALDELIGVSFLENLDLDDPAQAALVDLMGPSMKREVKRLESQGSSS